MSNDAEGLILGDAAIDATEEGRRGLLRRRRSRKGDRALTNCENCGSALTGEYCSNCGQHAIDYRRSLWRVLIDAADSFLNWDTKFLSSLGVLLIKPWRLTNDFNAGRRARYVHPLRLYLLASIAFFLIVKLVQINPEHVIHLDPQDRIEIAAALGKLTAPDSSLTPDERAKVESARERLVQANGTLGEEEKAQVQQIVASALASKMKDKFERKDRSRLRKALASIPATPPAPAPAATAEDGNIDPSESSLPNATLAPSIPPTPSVAAPSPKQTGAPKFSSDDEKKRKDAFGAWIEGRIKDKVGEGGSKAKLFLETLRNNIPTMMLCCVPLFALVLKVLYFRKRRYYVEHLVYALHIHTFAYVGVTLITLAGMGIARFSETARVLTVVFLSVALFVQVFLSIRRVYGQGWFFTTFKFLVGGFVYFLILVCAVGVTAFVTLLLPG
jgi:hypothetical protein